MKIVGLMRVKNASTWIEESVNALLNLCCKVIIFDDHSTDNTTELCKSETVSVFNSPYDSFDESRDKTFLLNAAIAVEHPDYVAMIDADEILENEGAAKIKNYIAARNPQSISLPIPYFWDSTEMIRVDGSFGRMVTSGRASIFRVSDLSPAQTVYEGSSYAAKGLHCGNLPKALVGPSDILSNCALWHYGYIDADLRRKKYDFYISLDGENPNEGGYKHILSGDPGGPGANEALVHAGPLVLTPVKTLCESQGFSRRPQECLVL